MRIFEFHFNPPEKNENTDHFFDSFFYEPKNIYEKRLGNLYMIGEITNLFPQNLGLIEKISKIIKERYYASTLQTPAKAFQGSLKSANDFLTKEVAKNNVSWLGNLNLTILSLASKDLGRTFSLNLAKVGNSKIFSEKEGKITNIGKNLDLEGIEPYPLKIFTNVVTGKIGEGNKIAILTLEIFELLSKENLLDNVLKINLAEEKKLKEILKNKEKEISNIEGVLLLIDSSKELSGDAALKPKLLTFKKELEKFSLKDALSPLSKTLTNFLLFFRNIFGETLYKIESKTKSFLRNILKLPQLPKLKNHSKNKTETKKKIAFPVLNLKEGFRVSIMPEMKRNLISSLLLILILVGGFFFFQQQEEKEIRIKEEIIIRTEESLKEVEKFLIIGEEEKAFLLLEESWNKISILAQEPWREKDRAKKLQESIEERLKSLSKLELVENPETIFEFDQQSFIPQRIVYFKGNLYLFSPVDNQLFQINLSKKKQEGFAFTEGIAVNLSATSEEAIFFFFKPDKILSSRINNGTFNFGDIFILEIPSSDFNFISMASHLKNIYLLEGKSGEIVKYSPPFSKGELWLKEGVKRVKETKSITVDGSIWVLSEDNKISRYFNGQYKEDLNLDFFPKPEKVQKILTSPDLPYLYLLEPSQNRVIILGKTGEIIRQFQSNQFDNLKDFTLASDGKIIYLLNGQKIYQLNL